VNGRPVLQFRNHDKSLTISNPMSGATAGDAYIVLKALPPAPYAGGLWNWANLAPAYEAYPGSDNSIGDNFGSTVSRYPGKAPTNLGEFHIYNVSSKAAEWQARVNGITFYRSTTNTVSFTTVPTIGATTYGFNGDIAEILVYDRVLTDPERAAVGGYLAKKYALFAAPPQVLGLNVQAASGTQAILSWTPSTQPNQVIYEIERSGNGITYEKIAETSLASFLDSGLLPASFYTYRVRTRTFAGLGAYSSAASLTTLAADQTDIPTGMRLWLSADSLTLASGAAVAVWRDQSGLSNDGTQSSVSQRPTYISGVLASRPVVRFVASASQFVAVPSIMTKAPAATNGEIYAVLKSSATVGATEGLWAFGSSNNVGLYPSNSGQIADDFGSTTVRGPYTPSAPLGQFNIYSVVAQPGSWSARLNGCLMASSTTNTVGWTTGPVIGASGGYSFTGDIAEVIAYGRALSEAERGALIAYLSRKYSLHTSDTTAPGTPTGLSHSGLTATSFTLSWSRPTDNVGVYSFDVLRNGVLVGTTETTSLKLVDLPPNSISNMTVRARDRAGNLSAESSVLVVTVLDTVAPTVPADLVVSNLSATAFTLSWAPSSDNVGVTTYEVFNNGGLVGTSSTTSFTWSGRLPSTTYGMSVRAKDAKGNVSSMSSTLNVTTPGYTLRPADGAIAAGLQFSAAIKADGSLYTWGHNAIGQLGLGTTTSVNKPTQVTSVGSVITTVALSDTHGLAIDTSGKVRAWGLNTNGQVGDGTTSTRTAPVTLSSIGEVIRVAAGASHSLALKTDGTVWAWGLNANGQLGDGTTTQRSSPVQVSGLVSIVAIAAGGSHSLALKSDGTLWVWGSNSNGQLGDGTTTQRNAPVQVSGMSGVSAITAGQFFSVATLTDGTAKSWGLNSLGQLGNGSTTQSLVPVTVAGLSNVKLLSAGREHAVALRVDGSVWGWGSTSQGQLGSISPSGLSTPAELSGLRNVVGVAAGALHSLFLKSDGAITAYGDNSAGALGDGYNVGVKVVPVQTGVWTDTLHAALGSSHSLSVRSDHTVWSWGSNSNGQLGDTTTVDKAQPIPLSLTGMEKVSAGLAHSLALASDGTVWAWGLNTNGQLGDGSTTQRLAAVQISSFSGVTAISAGASHSVALKSDGTVWTWGLNSSGQLGDGTTTQRTAPTNVSTLSGIVAVSAGEAHTLALKSDGTLWAWGNNGSGRLGDGTVTQRTAPVQITTLSDVAWISAGSQHSLAVKSDGTAWGWGLNSSGQVGDGTTTQRSSPVQLTSLTGMVTVSAGVNHSIGTKSDGTAWSWGANATGQIGDGTTVGRTTPVLTAMSSASRVVAGNGTSLAQLTNGTLRLWGNNNLGQAGTAVPARTAAAIRLKAISSDSDNDGIPDAWEVSKLGSVAASPTDDADKDGLTNIAEYFLNSDPAAPDADGDYLTDLIDPDPAGYYNGAAPTLAISSGNNQSQTVGQFNALPLKVAVLLSDGVTPLVNAPVEFLVITGNGMLSTTTGGTPDFQVRLSVRTGSDGIALVHFKQPLLPGVSSLIRASTGAQQVQFGATSSNDTGDTDNDGLTDAWETAQFGSLSQTASGDYDADGLTNFEEFVAGSDPLLPPAGNSATLVKLKVWTPLK
jgi:alpha-tubulin suppressor-like RCC1 family protein